MKRFVVILAFLALAGCETRGVKATDGITTTKARFEEAFNAGDAAGVAALYTTGAVVMAPNYARITGRRAIQGMWQNFFDAEITDIDLKTVELDIYERRASEYGTFSFTAPDGQGGNVKLKGKYIVLWRQDSDGVWRLHRDIWNNDPNE
jgi:uncharacterized protein (TIGR02246 family)